MERKLNVIFGFLLVVVFVTEATPNQQWNITLAILLSTVFSLTAFLFRRLTLDGMFAAILVGIYVLGLGGWSSAYVLLLFFVSSSIVSVGRKQKLAGHPDPASRNGNQVWANGFWLVVFLVIATIFDGNWISGLLLSAAMGAIATATADTWGTEIGMRFSKNSYLITNFRKVEIGSDGGVSIYGTLASLLGSCLIAFASVYFFSMDFGVFFCIFVAGFLGSIADSYFGAIFQRNNSSAVLPIINKKVRIDNNMVNALATGIGGLLTIIVNLIFL